MNLLSRIVITLLAFFVTAVVAAEGAPYPDPDLYPVPCGKVTELKLSTKDDFALNWSIKKFREKPRPDTNETFVEVSITVKTGFSIGKYDFELSGYPCLAIAEGDKPYDPENKEIKADNGERSVKLLFKGKKADKAFNLIFKYSTKDALSESLEEEIKRVELPFLKAAAAADGGGDDKGAGDEKPKEKTEKKKAKGKPKMNDGW